MGGGWADEGCEFGEAGGGEYESAGTVTGGEVCGLE